MGFLGEHKVCTLCGADKDFSEFFRSKQSNNGSFRDSACKECKMKKTTVWRRSNPEKWKTIFRRYDTKKKQKRQLLSQQRKELMAPIYAERAKAGRKDWERTPAVLAYRSSYKKRPERIQRTKELSYRPEKLFARATRIRARRKEDPKFRLDGRMSCALYASLRSKKSGRTWESLVGYTLQELTAHLESKFSAGMSWDNMDLWEIDHVIPKSAFSYTCDTDASFKDCWSLNNLQPLWNADNRRKGARIGWNGKLF